MPSRPTLLFILSLPVGAVVYTIAATVFREVFPAEPIVSLLVPLFVAGLAMMPFVIPFFDRKAKEDLAAHRAQQEAARPPGPDPDGALADEHGAVASEAHEAEGADR